LIKTPSGTNHPGVSTRNEESCFMFDIDCE
jgi:hypothetical protein